jgi:hypothetical protein
MTGVFLDTVGIDTVGTNRRLGHQRPMARGGGRGGAKATILASIP